MHEKTLLLEKISNCANNIEQKSVGLSLNCACIDIPCSSMQTHNKARRVFYTANTFTDSSRNQTMLKAKKCLKLLINVKSLAYIS